MAVTPGVPTGTETGQAISRLGGVASTCTVTQPGADTLPALLNDTGAFCLTSTRELVAQPDFSELDARARSDNMNST